MPSTTPISSLYALHALSALVAEAAASSPVPTPTLTEPQLRATDHRLVSADTDPDGQLLEALTAKDFLFTASDGRWLDRAAFLAQRRLRTPQQIPSVEDLRVRLFGRVALVHAVFSSVTADGSAARTRCTDVHVWNGTAWELVSAQNTPLCDGVAVALQSATAPAHAPWRGEDPVVDDLVALEILNQNYVRAFRDADVAWYDAHLTPDYVVTSGDGSFRDRAAALANFARPTFATQFRSFPVNRVSVRRFDDVALIHAENAYELKDQRTGVSRYTDVWHKRDGRWLCIAAHITPCEAPA